MVQQNSHSENSLNLIQLKDMVQVGDLVLVKSVLYEITKYFGGKISLDGLNREIFTSISPNALSKCDVFIRKEQKIDLVVEGSILFKKDPFIFTEVVSTAKDHVFLKNVLDDTQKAFYVHKGILLNHYKLYGCISTNSFNGWKNNIEHVQVTKVIPSPKQQTTIIYPYKKKETKKYNYQDGCYLFLKDYSYTATSPDKIPAGSICFIERISDYSYKCTAQNKKTYTIFGYEMADTCKYIGSATRKTKHKKLSGEISENCEKVKIQKKAPERKIFRAMGVFYDKNGKIIYKSDLFQLDAVYNVGRSKIFSMKLMSVAPFKSEYFHLHEKDFYNYLEVY